MATRRPTSRAERDDSHAAAREAADARKNKLVGAAAASILGHIQSGERLAWHFPWKTGPKRSGHPLRPMNATTGVDYTGGNRIILADALVTHYRVEGQPFDNRWLTKKQAEAIGGQLKDGVDKQGVLLIKIVKDTFKKDVVGENGQTEKQERAYTAARLFTVYHVSLFDGLQLPEPEPLPVIAPRDPTMQLCAEGQDIIEAFIKKTGLTIVHGNGIDRDDAAFYSPKFDTVNMPRKELFDTDEDYYDTLMHEMGGHSTMAEHRMNRKGALGSFGDETYAKEELRADFASAFLGAVLDLPASERRIKAHAAYIQSWARNLKPQDIFTAAREAEKICDWVLELGRGYRLELDQAQSRAPAIELQRPTLDTVPLLPAPTGRDAVTSMERRAPKVASEDTLSSRVEPSHVALAR
ncbi:ssDNA-binding domain-containing protein [Burkholderia vietnamiensis]|uniref:Antirestriction protein-like protein n=1 Tax=Burkholderia vietnamiensis (strain G4 / LMG 22486) TaxID=269482 RepID=A4JFJ3_BURVG|nr:Antirestriction protein-like protein [Burkholderia vietnamiensis G4]MCB4344806.1 ssDNA-binding domain-containing protein [Burkholderia vietnamiensis]